MNESINDIIIVGSGTAGWLTAGLLAAQHQHADGGPRANHELTRQMLRKLPSHRQYIEQWLANH